MVECRTRNRESPSSNPPLLPFRRLGIFRSLHRRPCSLSCINEYLAIEVFHTRDPNHVTAGGDSILGVKLCDSCSGSGIDMLSKLAANLVRASLGLM